MIKVAPTYHSGLAFVQLSRLPAIQFEYFDQYIPEVDRFELIVDNQNIKDCISYEAYEHWYQLINPQYFEYYFETQI